VWPVCWASVKFLRASISWNGSGITNQPMCMSDCEKSFKLSSFIVNLVSVSLSLIIKKNKPK